MNYFVDERIWINFLFFLVFMGSSFTLFFYSLFSGQVDLLSGFVLGLIVASVGFVSDYNFSVKHEVKREKRRKV